jgi:hypothetical protein
MIISFVLVSLVQRPKAPDAYSPLPEREGNYPNG